MQKKYIQTACFGVPEFELVWRGSYRPRIAPEQLKKLWRLKERSGKAITQLIAEAIDLYLDSVEKGHEK